MRASKIGSMPSVLTSVHDHLSNRPVNICTSCLGENAHLFDGQSSTAYVRVPRRIGRLHL